MKSYVYGVNVLETIVREAPDRVLQVYIEGNRRSRRVSVLKSMLKQQGLSWQPISGEKIAQLIDSDHHQGVLAEVRRPPVISESEMLKKVVALDSPFLCVLEGVQDPRNLGACLRTALAAGVDMVIIPRHDACDITPVARKTASGAAELITVARVGNISRTLTLLKERTGTWVVGAQSGSGRNLYDVALDGPLAMVFGSEGAGLKPLTLDCCDFVAEIPIMGGVDSLNVSVAVGVSLFEARRQRGPSSTGKRNNG